MEKFDWSQFELPCEHCILEKARDVWRKGLVLSDELGRCMDTFDTMSRTEKLRSKGKVQLEIGEIYLILSELTEFLDVYWKAKCQ